jgi:hypothetical protein
MMSLVVFNVLLLTLLLLGLTPQQAVRGARDGRA